MALSSTQRKVLASISLVLALDSTAAPKSKNYENFNLPQAAGTSAPAAPPARSYVHDRVQIGKNARMVDKGVNAQEYLFAKEAYVTEKRDEAIKLLRQELDAGFKQNRDNILLRLGQLNAEKYMEISYRENEYYTQQLEQYEKIKNSDKNAKAPRLDNGRSQRYLKDALALFSSLEKEFPRHPKMDEVVFFIGFVEMETGNTAKGTRYLERVVKEYPKSRKFEEAVVYLGDQLFEKAKFRDALVRYRILTQRTASSLNHYARYKIAWCELNTGEGSKGLSHMKGLIAELAGNQEVSKFNLREQALRDLVVFYGELGQVDEAFAYFSETQSRDKAVANLRVIADILKSKARDEAAMKAYKRLVDEFPNTLETPRLYVGMHESMARIGKTDKAVQLLSEALGKFGPNSEWAKSFPPDKATDVKSASDAVAAEAERAAFFYHASAQKSSHKTSTKLAQQLYQGILDNYPDYKERKKISFYLGEIFYSQGKWVEAADSYMVAARTPPKDKVADEGTYNALLALDRLTAKNDNLERYSKEDQKKVDLTPEEIPANEKKFMEVAEFYVREYPQGSRVVDVQFRIAAIYYRYHHFDKSQEMFRTIAMKYPRHRSATTAANIVLDIYNIKKDYPALDAAAGLFARTEGLGDNAFRAEMAKISGEIGFKKIESFEANNKWTEAGDNYYQFYKNNPTGPLAEKSLYNAFISYEKAKDASKMSEISRLFIAKFPKSDYTKRFMLASAKSAEREYDYELAQKLYSEFHTKFPTDKEAPKALFNAAVFAELLEKNTQALSLYETYLKGREVGQEEKRAIWISQAKIYRREKNWDKVNVVYRRLAREAKSDAEKINILGELARQYEKGGKLNERNAVLTELRYLYDSKKGLKLSGPAVAFVAEAKFRAIAPQREKYEKIALRFPPEDLVFLLKRKQTLLAKLAKSYDEVVEVGVPDWGVAALFEKGAAFQNFVDGFKGLQIPSRYKTEEREELDKQLKVIEAKLVAPVATKANDFLKACSTRATEFFVANEFASKCRERLEKTAKVSEPVGIYPQPSYWTTRWTSEGVASK